MERRVMGNRRARCGPGEKVEIISKPYLSEQSNIASNRLNRLSIGLPGVGNFKEVIPFIIRWNVKKVVIAYDADSLYKEESINGKNEKVFEQLVKLSQELLHLDIEVAIWTWNCRDGKGLDDLLNNNKLPIEINLRTKERSPVTLKFIY
jgi:hypothetical protein